ncbi:hypothetical protein PG5_54490 [Pseudomonas sp. G5(2012)]|nr:hypothetical protein PG5_54490 [Pseudomonas sp. G5(2012)]
MYAPTLERFPASGERTCSVLVHGVLIPYVVPDSANNEFCFCFRYRKTDHAHGIDQMAVRWHQALSIKLTRSLTAARLCLAISQRIHV